MSRVMVGSHEVPEHEADLFRDGENGETISDAEWDEQKRRLEGDNTQLVPEQFR